MNIKLSETDIASAIAGLERGAQLTDLATERGVTRSGLRHAINRFGGFTPYQTSKRRSEKERRAFFWSKCRPVHDGDACWIWEGVKDKKGYGLYSHIGIKTRLAHRIAWILTYGCIDDRLLACHTCDNPSCVNPSHLFLGTVRDNSRDMMNKGRGRGQLAPPCGEKNPNAKIKEADVHEIRRLGELRLMPQRAIARKFGISRSSVLDILRGKSWKYVPVLPL